MGSISSSLASGVPPPQHLNTEVPTGVDFLDFPNTPITESKVSLTKSVRPPSRETLPSDYKEVDDEKEMEYFFDTYTQCVETKSAGRSWGKGTSKRNPQDIRGMMGLFEKKGVYEGFTALSFSVMHPKGAWVVDNCVDKFKNILNIGTTKRLGDMCEILGLEQVGKELLEETGFTPLHLSVMFGPPETVQLLLDRGADVEAKTRSGFTARSFLPGRNESSISKIFDTYYKQCVFKAVERDVPLFSHIPDLGDGLEEALGDFSEFDPNEDLYNLPEDNLNYVEILPASAYVQY